MNGYLCHFMFPVLAGAGISASVVQQQDTVELEMHTVQDNPDESGLERLGAFVAGFWLTEALELCTGADPDKHFWIPPTAIYCIELFERPETPAADQWTPEQLADFDKRNVEALEFTKNPDKCEHGRGMTDYCEPCGRVNGSII
jgi:hypothetical protein